MRQRSMVVGLRALGSGAVALVALATAPLVVSVEKSDPSFYLSYALGYRDLAERFGQTYHGNRLAYLGPEAAAFGLLGPGTGYLAIRWLFLAAAVGLVMAIARPRVGVWPAAALAVGVGLTPWLPKQLLWVNYDGFSAVYLIALAHVLLRPGRSRAGDVLAGVLALLVVNTNLVFSVMVAGALLGWWVSSGETVRRRSARLGWMAAGAVLAETAISVALVALGAEGPWLAEWVAVDVALRIAGDATWFIPLPTALQRSPHLVAALVLGVLATVVGARRGDGPEAARTARFGGVWMLGSGAIVLFLHLVMNSLWLGWPMYVIVFIAPTMVCLVGLAEVIAGPRRPRGLLAPTLVLVWAGVLVGLWSAGRLLPWAAAVSGAVLLGAAAVVLRRHAVAEASLARPVIASLLPLVLLVTWSAVTQVPTPAGFTDLEEREAFEWDTFDHIVAVHAMVESNVTADRDLVFWHRTDAEYGEWLRRINMAYYGTGGGRLHVRGDVTTGLPNLTEAQIDSLRERSPVTVVLLGLSRAELTAGVVALSTRVTDARSIDVQEFPGRVFDLHVALLEVG